MESAPSPFQAEPTQINSLLCNTRRISVSGAAPPEGFSVAGLLRETVTLRRAQREHRDSQSLRGKAVRPDPRGVFQRRALRVCNIHDPRLPTETGWFLPPERAEPRRSQSGMLATDSSPDTPTDTRHNIYLLDSGGLWILRATGVNAPTQH